MGDLKQFPPILRVRCKSGNNAGMWLWMMDVSDKGLRIQRANWPVILHQMFRYSFHPHFVANESAALRAISREIADGYVRVLASKDIDAEVTETPQTPKQPKIG